MGKSMDERLRWLIEYLKETGREEQAALLEEYDLEAYQVVITAKCLVCGLLQLATLEDGLDETWVWEQLLGLSGGAGGM